MIDKAARPVLVWFRRDLRLADNPALSAAVRTGRRILPLYILDETGDCRRPGGASRWWLDKSLRALDANLRGRGGRLILRRGDPEAELRRLIDETAADTVFLNRQFEPDALARDADIVHALSGEGVDCHGFNGTLLSPPGSVRSGAGTPYKMFTPFLKALIQAAPEHRRQAAPKGLRTPAAPASDDMRLGHTYPCPVVDHADARMRARYALGAVAETSRNAPRDEAHLSGGSSPS